MTTGRWRSTRLRCSRSSTVMPRKRSTGSGERSSTSSARPTPPSASGRSGRCAPSAASTRRATWSVARAWTPPRPDDQRPGRRLRRSPAPCVAWLDGLDDAQRAECDVPFETSERFFWAYTPGPPRRGLALGEMRPDQRAASRAIVAAAMSARTAGEIAAIVELEIGPRGARAGGRSSTAGAAVTRSGTGSPSSATRA